MNSASPQALGQMLLAAANDVDARRHLVILTSGSASSVYPGWASYGAGKAAVNKWVRDVGADQSERGGVQVLAVTPGTVELRNASDDDFPKRQKFIDAEESGKLTHPGGAGAQVVEGARPGSRQRQRPRPGRGGRLVRRRLAFS